METKRVVFLDYLRVIAIFMVMVVHACEQYYFGPDGGLLICSRRDALCVTILDSICRASVPLFVLASAYLLFPVSGSTGAFIRRRFLRVLIPYFIWACVYTIRFSGDFSAMLFNFPMATGGHLWFVPMLLGLYLLMPLLSPWAKQASEKEIKGWIALWLFTTLFPFLRSLEALWQGAPDFGVVPFLYGECPWNEFGMFHYVSGFFGYMLLGFWFRRFAPAYAARTIFLRAIPLGLIGLTLVAGFFYYRIPGEGHYPVSAPYAKVVSLEMSWGFCSFGVVLLTLSFFSVIRKFTAEGAIYRYLIRPLAEASYGIYLVHILILVACADWVRAHCQNPIAIPFLAFLTFCGAAFVSVTLRKIPKIGKWIVG